jgi:purine-binding chemotaxis protein CheW
MAGISLASSSIQRPITGIGARAMQPPLRLLVFSMDRHRFAFDLESVERVVRAVALTVVPGLPPTIRGIFSLHGQVIPVGDLRRRMNLPDREIGLDDWIVVVRTPSRLLGVLVDGSGEVMECPADAVTPSESVFRGAELTQGIARVRDEVILIQNLVKFLSIEENLALDEALDAR